MQINIFKPQNMVLQNYIECFYTLQRHKTNSDITYLGFPSTHVFISSFKNAELVINKSTIKCSFKKKESIESLLIFDFNAWGQTQYEGETNEICIYFKPLGLNNFLKGNFSAYTQKGIAPFNFFEDYDVMMLKIMNLENNSDKIKALESYWLSKLNPFHHPFIKQTIDEITTNDTKLKVSDLAKKHKVSRPTFNTEFVKHIGMTPSQFIKINRFRKALKIATTTATKEQLIDVAFLVEYFDQSHMAKDFKTLTGYLPRAFFSKISRIQNSQINWMFL